MNELEFFEGGCMIFHLLMTFGIFFILILVWGIAKGIDEIKQSLDEIKGSLNESVNVMLHQEGHLQTIEILMNLLRKISLQEPTP